MGLPLRFWWEGARKVCAQFQKVVQKPRGCTSFRIQMLCASWREVGYGLLLIGASHICLSGVVSSFRPESFAFTDSCSFYSRRSTIQATIQGGPARGRMWELQEGPFALWRVLKSKGTATGQPQERHLPERTPEECLRTTGFTPGEGRYFTSEPISVEIKRRLFGAGAQLFEAVSFHQAPRRFRMEPFPLDQIRSGAWRFSCS
jgi:hypothetical protein